MGGHFVGIDPPMWAEMLVVWCVGAVWSYYKFNVKGALAYSFDFKL